MKRSYWSISESEHSCHPSTRIFRMISLHFFQEINSKSETHMLIHHTQTGRFQISSHFDELMKISCKLKIIRNKHLKHIPPCGINVNTQTRFTFFIDLLRKKRNLRVVTSWDAPVSCKHSVWLGRSVWVLTADIRPERHLTVVDHRLSARPPEPAAEAAVHLRAAEATLAKSLRRRQWHLWQVSSSSVLTVTNKVSSYLML